MGLSAFKKSLEIQTDNFKMYRMKVKDPYPMAALKIFICMLHIKKSKKFKTLLVSGTNI